MIRLTVVTLAALYFVLYVFGDETRRPEEVSRAEGPGLTLGLASYLPELPDTATVATSSRISEAEAVKRALEAGAELRAERKSSPRTGGIVFASADVADKAVPGTTASTWYVTGERVNLRGGPGTSNPVVGQITFGSSAEVLEDQGGWYRIRPSDGSASGWIFGKFLSQQQPG
jgi:uncharacterized protein YgiM (DUF1202 family)